MTWNIMNLVLQSHNWFLWFLVIGSGAGAAAQYLLCGPLLYKVMRNPFPEAFVLTTVVLGIWISIFAVMNFLGYPL
ncbi:hypothetical protein EV361DRAFT_957013 [Lentinula raphanica]|nr:hypothetical protein EV361DRAFT_957013 [Lentinula raphanica]